MSHSKTLVPWENEGEKELQSLSKAIREMPRDMMMFSTCMRSLYNEMAVGTNERAARKFRQLRNDTRDDAMVYLKVILPKSKEVVSSIQSFFEYYNDLDFEEWKEILPDILSEVKVYRSLCKSVLQMHKEIIVPLKRREDEAKLVMTELRDLQREYLRQKAELQSSAEDKATWSRILLFLPVINLIACPLLKSSADSDMAKAVMKGAEANIQESAALAVSECMIPALNGFVDGLQKAAGFFAVMENKLGSFSLKGDKSLPDPKKIHFKMMGKKASQIISHCTAFIFALPMVETDLKAIPSTGTDQNYVDRWLKRQQQIIDETLSNNEQYSEH